MTQPSAAVGRQFAAWLYNIHPDLFLAAYHLAKFGATPRTTGLGDVSDFLSSIGDDVSSAVSSVGDWMTSSQGLSSLSSLGTAYLQGQAQQSVLQTQIARVQANQSPLAVGYTTNAQGQIVGVLPISSAGTPVTVSSQVAPQVASYVQTTPSVLSAYTPSFNWQQYLPYIAIGGALLLGMIVLRR